MSPCLKMILILLTITSCNKEKPKDPVNIWLKDKSLSEIKAAIQGNWQLHYSLGGFTGNLRKNHFNSFIEFKLADSIYWKEQSNLLVADKLQWNKKIDMIGDSTFIMSFCEYRANICYPFSWGVQGIRNDTLILYDDATDPDAYYLTKK